VKSFQLHDALIRRLNAQGRAWLRLIRNSTGIIAAFTAFPSEAFVYYQIGLDTELERYAPGKALMFEVIKGL
jgi:CelD/BcsL family acetyltransferase involved in cellulose biosynthesis